MSAGIHNIYIEQGATWTLTLQWAGSAVVNPDLSVTVSDPVNITGYIGRMQIRKKQGDPALVTATTANGKITLVGATGTVSIKLTAEDTDLLTMKSRLYDLELESPSGNVYRVLQRSVTVSPNITQDVSDPIVSD